MAEVGLSESGKLPTHALPQARGVCHQTDAAAIAGWQHGDAPFVPTFFRSPVAVCRWYPTTHGRVPSRLFFFSKMAQHPSDWRADALSAPVGWLQSKRCHHMNEGTVVPWLLQPARIWMALAGGFVPGLIAAFKRRAKIRWYLYGFICILIARPLLALPTIHVLLIRRRDMSKPSPQQQRRVDALDLLAESSVRSYPSWIADLTRKSPDRIDRRRYAYEHIRPGEALELVREFAKRSDDRAVAYCHRGVRVGYIPKRQRWIAEALDDGLCLAAVAVDVKLCWMARRRAKFVGTRIVVLNDGRKR